MIRAAWSWMWGQSIRRQLVTGVVLVYVAVMTVFVFQLVSRQRAFLREKAESRTFFHATLLAASVRPGVMSNDLAGIDEILAALRTDASVRSAMVFAPDGRILAHTDKRRNGLYLQDPRSISLLGGRPVPQLVSASKTTIDAAAPVLLGNQHVGWVRVTRDLSDDNTHIHSLTLWGAAFTLIAVAIGTLVTIALAGAILRPLRLLLAGAERISANQLDEPVPITTQNEVGTVSATLNSAMMRLKRQIAERAQAEEQLRGQTARIMEEAKVLAAAAGEILYTATRFSGNAADAAAAVSETSVSIEEIRQTSHLASEQAANVLEDARAAAETSQGGMQAAEGAGEGMQRIRDQMAALAAMMGELSQQTQVIGEIIASVDAISATSSLLAVNAAIEASRAGEHGRGFSVVAQEVKNLAKQSKQATARVRVILGDIQKSTSSAVLATEQGLKVVDLGADQSSQAGGSINMLAENISKAAKTAGQIAESSRQQLTGIEQVADAMQSVKTVTTRNLESARDLEKAAENLSALGKRLSVLVENSRSGRAS